MYNNLISGAIIMSCWAIALFFIRFFRKSYDPIFLYFAVAFFLFGTERIAFVFSADEMKVYVYLIRLAAFMVIVFGIIHKNRIQS